MHIPAIAIPLARAQAGGARTHPKVERMTGIEPVASTMARSRSTTELHPQSCEARSRPVPALPRGNLFMNVAAGAALRRDGRKRKNKKARIHQDSGPLVREGEEVRLHSSCSRMYQGIAITMHGPRVARALKPARRRDAHERTPTRGSDQVGR